MDSNKHIGIDLHIHSTASDGSMSPVEILCLADKLRLKAISITDHDTLQGSKEVLASNIPSGLEFLTGIEMSTASPDWFTGTRSLHILGYGIRIHDPDLNHTLDKLQKARKDRNPKIVNRLQDLGFSISFEEVLNETNQDSQTGRPHIALLMKKKGFVGSINEAFDKYLAEGKPAYIDKYRVYCEQAIEIILNAGGIPVLAHPHVLETDNNPKKVERLIVFLKEMGLKGIEAYYPKHTPEYTTHLIDIANRYNLIITGGTDFHGKMKPDIEMGFGTGNFHVPYKLYEKLIAKL